VASIRTNASSDTGQTIGARPGGRFVGRNVTGSDLVASAYGLRLQGQIVGAPDWFSRARFDVEAAAEKAEAGAGWDRLMMMLRTLLEDRFGLKARAETREVPAYALRRGPALRLTPARFEDCAPPPTGFCGGFQTGPGRVTGRHVSVGQVAALLTGRTGRMVIDETGIDGRYDLELTWTPENAPPPGGPTPDGSAAPFDPSGPSIFTAVREQLGLRLDTTRGPMQVLVIESVHRPSDN
jgi:uncharacterized protein (TIGR03435 family)